MAASHSRKVFAGDTVASAEFSRRERSSQSHHGLIVPCTTGLTCCIHTLPTVNMTSGSYSVLSRLRSCCSNASLPGLQPNFSETPSLSLHHPHIQDSL
jgi:hypothetical protein